MLEVETKRHPTSSSNLIRSRKVTCPECGHVMTYTAYVNHHMLTGIPANCGACKEAIPNPEKLINFPYVRLRYYRMGSL